MLTTDILRLFSSQRDGDGGFYKKKQLLFSDPELGKEPAEKVGKIH